MQYLRIKKKKEFSRLLKNGRRAHAEHLTIVYLPDKERKMAVCVGKKYGKSVVRNHIKRLLREAYRAQSAAIAPCSMLLIPKVSKVYSFRAFQKDLSRLLKKEKLVEIAPEAGSPAKLEIAEKDGV